MFKETAVYRLCLSQFFKNLTKNNISNQMMKQKVFGVFAFIFSCSFPAFAQLQINEVMQSNVSVIMDDLNDFPDSWIELYNSSDQTVNLNEYAVSVKDSYKKAYALPDRAVAPGEYVIVYCDKVDHVEFPEALMHADFRLDSGKGSVYLWKNKEIVETLNLKKMPSPNIAYGRQSETSDVWGYQAVTTPGAANCGELVTDILPDPVFSIPGALCTSSQVLELSIPEGAPAGAQLHYTLDGSAPDAESPVYAEPINIDANTVVRAVLIADGYMSPLPVTESFIFHPREQTTPIVCFNGDPEYFYDSQIGILVDGTYNPDKPNYKYDWRRPVNLEYFEVDGTCPINQVIETRLKGGGSRSKPLRSMVAYANKRFGTSRLTHEFFPGQKPGLTDFKSIELRNAGQDFHELYMRDALLQRFAGSHCDIDWAAWQPAVIYINGEYKGILNVRERANEDYIYTNYNELEDIVTVENWGEVEGDAKFLADFRSFFFASGHTYEEYAERMEIPVFMNLMITEAISSNPDFPSNNIVMWRPTADGGRWRWIFKDLDGGLGFIPQGWDLKYLNWLYDPNYDTSITPGNKPGATLLFRHLMEIEGAKNDFIDRAFVYMGDFMKPAEFNLLAESMSATLMTEYPAHRALYDYEWSWNKHEVLVPKVENWYKNRVEFMYGHIAEFFELGAPVKLEIDLTKHCEDANISLNGINLVTKNFDGKWASGRKLKFTVEYPEGKEYKIAGWKMIVTKNGQTTETSFNNRNAETTMPDADSVKFEPIPSPAGIDEITADDGSKTVEWYDLQGRRLGTKRPTASGLYIRKAGNNVSKVML